MLQKSKIELSDQMFVIRYQEKEKCFKRTYHLVLGIFAVLTLGFLVVCLFQIVDLKTFFIELTSFSGALIIACNSYLFFQYWK